MTRLSEIKNQRWIKLFIHSVRIFSIGHVTRFFEHLLIGRYPFFYACQKKSLSNLCAVYELMIRPPPLSRQVFILLAVYLSYNVYFISMGTIVN